MKSSMMNICIFILLLSILTGCKKEEILTYDVNQNLRITQVQYYGMGMNNFHRIPDIKRVMKYYYNDSSGLLQKIERDAYFLFQTP